MRHKTGTHDTRRKVQDLGEIKRWYDAGWTYQDMVEEYWRKYQIEATVAMFANIRSRQGWEKRLPRSSDLIPWVVHEEHLGHYYAVMLRSESRRRRGEPLNEQAAARLPGFLRNLEEVNGVVHYDADAGWFIVPRRPEDKDIIREPSRTGLKRLPR